MNLASGFGRWPAALVAAAVACAAGCGTGGPVVDRGRLEPVPVAGTVTLDGRPLPDVEVRLVADDRTFAAGVTDAAGRYEMRCDPATPGVPPGPKRVELRRAAPAGSEGGDPAEGPAAVAAGGRLESSDRVIVTGPLTDLDFRLVTTPSGS